MTAIPILTAGDIVRVRLRDGSVVRRQLLRDPIRWRGCEAHTGRLVFFAVGYPGCFNVESVVEVVRRRP